MKPSLPTTLLTLFGFAASALAEEPNLPSPEMKLKEEWTTIEKKSFNDWKIEKFVGWSGVADGGSMAFDFLTDQGIEFDVLVANPEY